MPRYSSLNSHTQLEQTIAGDLQSALEKRGFTVIHNGTWDSHAPGGKPDIAVFDDEHVLIFEVTKSKSAAQDREFQSIRSHLKDIKAQNPEKQCFCIFVSPKTSERTLESIHDHNYQRASEGKRDMKILPLAFGAFELWVTRLKESPGYNYPMKDFMSILEKYPEFTDDSHIFRLLVEHVFPGDAEIRETLLEWDDEYKIEAIHMDDLGVLVDRVNQHENDLSDFDIRLRTLFDLLTERSIQTWSKFAKTQGLSMVHVYALQELYYRGFCNMSSIGELLQITAATSQLAEQLVQSGMVERIENPENRRKKLLKLTLKGITFIEQGLERQHGWLEDFQQNASREEYERVIAMFKILAIAAQRMRQPN
jgi:DNA-binding MarR family transcriptional regulator